MRCNEMELKDILAIKKATDSLDCTETHKLITLRENYAIGPNVGRSYGTQQLVP